MQIMIRTSNSIGCDLDCFGCGTRETMATYLAEQAKILEDGDTIRISVFMERDERLLEALNNLSDEKLISVFNEYCDRNCYYDDKYEPMSTFDEMMENRTPIEVAGLIYEGSLNPRHRWYTYNENAVHSYEDSHQVASEIREYYVNNLPHTLISYIVNTGYTFHVEELEEAYNEEEEDD